MSKIIFAVDEHNHVKVLKIDLDGEDCEVLSEDIQEMEYGIFREGEDYAMGVYKGSLKWVDTTSHYPEYEPDGYWDISDDFKLITNVDE